MERGAGVGGVNHERLVQAILAALATVVVVVSIGPYPVGVFQDDGIYTVLAKSLATGEGYRYLQMPGTPNATHYPPLYPLFLAALWKLFPAFPANVTVFKFVNAALIGVTAVLTWRFARRWVGMGPWAAALTAGAFAAGTPMVFLGVLVLSEPLFLAVLFPVLMACERATRTGARRDAILAGVAGGLLALIRTLGAAAIPATALVLVWRRRWVPAILVVTAGVLVMLPWQVWIAANEPGIHPAFTGKFGSYGGWLGEAVQRGGVPWLLELSWFNVRLLIGQGWEMLAVLRMPAAVQWSGTVAATAAFTGGWWLLLRRAPVAAWFIAFYMALVIAWPFGPSRFTFAIWPLLGLPFGLAIERAWTWRPAVRPWAVARVAALAAALFLAAGYARYNYLGYRFGWWVQVQEPVAERARHVADWVRGNTAPSALLATEDDLLLYLYTGRQAVPLGTFTPYDHLDAQTPAFMSETLGTILRDYDVDYVLATTDVGAHAARGLMRRDPPGLELVGVLKLGAVFRPATRTDAP